jgi:hypothetical protein
MSQNLNNKSPIKITYKGTGMAIGMVFGGLIGWLIGNPIIFAGGGLVLGFAIGSAMDSRS